MRHGHLRALGAPGWHFRLSGASLELFTPFGRDQARRCWTRHRTMVLETMNNFKNRQFLFSKFQNQIVPVQFNIFKNITFPQTENIRVCEKRFLKNQNTPEGCEV